MPPKKQQPDLILDGVIRALEGALNDLKSLVDPTPRETPKKAAKGPPGAVAEGIRVFNGLHLAAFGRAPYLTIADKVALGRLYADLPDFRAMVGMFLASNDPWIVKNGFAPRFLPAQVEALRKSMAPKAPDILAKEWK